MCFPSTGSCATATYASWALEPVLALSGSMSSLAWRVPDHVKEMVPEHIRRLLGCSGSQALVVLRNLHFLDVCAGKAGITRWATLGGLQGCAYDRSYGPHMDMNTDEGLALALILLFRVQPGGLLFIAAQCSSWVWISRSRTGRTKENPEGDYSKPHVAEGNALNSRTALLCTIASAIGAFWVIEQPASSLFFATACMAPTQEGHHPIRDGAAA